jgi:hypothetical protein
MCLAIPYGRQGATAGTHLGRWLRGRTARLPGLAGTVILLLAASSLLFGPGRAWPWALLLLYAALASIAFARLLDRLPARCGTSETGYPRLVGIAGFPLLGAVLVLAGPGADLAGGGWLGVPGVLLLALGWHLARGSLRWAVAWCRGQPGAALRRLPRSLDLGLGALAVLAAGALAANTPTALAGAALALVALTLIALAARAVSAHA